MSKQEVLSSPTYPMDAAFGDVAKRRWKMESAERRWAQLVWTYEARALNLRRAAARARRIAVR